MIYCVDILDALTKDFFARKGNPIEEAVEMNEIQLALERPGYEPISSTLWRQREEFCARLIQITWKRYKNKLPGDSQPSTEEPQPSCSSAAYKKGDNSDENLSCSVIIDDNGVHKVILHSLSKSSSIASRIAEV